MCTCGAGPGEGFAGRPEVLLLISCKLKLRPWRRLLADEAPRRGHSRHQHRLSHFPTSSCACPPSTINWNTNALSLGHSQCSQKDARRAPQTRTLDAHMRKGTIPDTLPWIHSAHPNLRQTTCPKFWTVLGKPRRTWIPLFRNLSHLPREEEGLYKPKESQTPDLHFTLHTVQWPQSKEEGPLEGSGHLQCLGPAGLRQLAFQCRVRAEKVRRQA